MANIKSAKKRILTNRKKYHRNKIIKSSIKTIIKKIINNISKNNTKNINILLNNAISKINKASSKKIYHKNKASRKISKLSKYVNLSSKKNK